VRQLAAARHGHQPRFGRVLVVQVAARRADMLPAVVVKLFEQVAVLHDDVALYTPMAAGPQVTR
jgi:hypothetical protein